MNHTLGLGGLDPGEAWIVWDGPSFDAWRRRLGLLRRRRDLPLVAFRLAELSEEHNRNLSLRADEYRRACGCTSGSLVMSLALVGAIAWLALSDGAWTDPRHLATLVALGLAGASIGKLAGVLWARWRLLGLARELSEIVRRASPDARPGQGA